MIGADDGDGIDRLEESNDLSPIPLIVVPHQESRLSGRLWPAIALLGVALAGIAYRASIADWQGLARRPIPRTATVEAPPILPKKAKTPAKPVEIALAPRVDVVAPPKVEAPTPKADVPTPKADVATPKADVSAPELPKVDPWKEIEREAERKKAERAELDRIKEDEAEKARHQPLREIPPPLNRQALAALRDARQKEFLKAVEQARREQLEFQKKFLEQVRRDQGRSGSRQFQEMVRQQQAMMAQMRRLAAAPGIIPMPPPPEPLGDGDFPFFGRERPGLRSDRQTIRTPNGLIVIRRQWLTGDVPPPTPQPPNDDNR